MPASTGVQGWRAQIPTKEERDRDAAQAASEYEAKRRAIDANTARLRELRLAKEGADASRRKKK